MIKYSGMFLEFFMIAAILIWALAGLIFFVFGLMTIRILQKIFGIGSSTEIPFITVIFTGILFFTTMISYMTLFVKIGLIADLSILLTAVVYLFTDIKYVSNYLKIKLAGIKEINRWTLALFIVLFIVILFETSVYIPKNFDTPSYHAQAIRWIESYPVIPGLGNLNKHYAYNSHWLITCAAFSLSFLKIRSFHVLNGFILVLGCVFFISCINGFNKNKRSLPDITGMFTFPLIFYLSLNFSSSPGTDLVPAVLIMIFFCRLLRLNDKFNIHFKKKDNDRMDDIDFESYIVVFLSVFMITLKLSALPFIILSIPAGYALLRKNNFKNIAIVLTASVMIILPWIVRNVILSGYLIYPFDKLDFFRFDWKLPEALIRDDITGLINWSHPIANMPVWEYIPYWLKSIYFQYKIILYPLLVIFIGSIVFYLIRLILKPFLFKEYLAVLKKYFWFILMLYFSMIFLYLTAPDVRYGSAFYLLFFIFQIAPVLSMALSVAGTRRFAVLFPVSIMIIAVLFEAFLFNRYFYSGRRDLVYGKEDARLILSRLLLPADYGKDSSKPAVHILTNGAYSFTVYTAGNSYLCWYDPFPCTTLYEWNLGNGIELRGDSILKGFRISSKNGER